MTTEKPIDMVLYCPKCGKQHIDAPDERTPDWTNPPHKSHLCHGCGHIWRPSDTPTNGVERTASGKDADTAPTPPPQLDPVRPGEVLTDEEVLFAIFEARRDHNPFKRDGTTSVRIIRAAEQAILSKLAKQEPVARVKFLKAGVTVEWGGGPFKIKNGQPLYTHPPITPALLEAAEKAKEIIAQLIACHDEHEPPCPAIQVGQETIDELDAAIEAHKRAATITLTLPVDT